MAERAPTVRVVRDLLVQFQARNEPALLDEALTGVAALLDAPGFADLDPPARAFAWTLGAAASTWRARTVAARGDDLDRAVEWSDRAVLAWPADDPNRAKAQSNLATALTDRYETTPDRADLDRAVALYEVAIPALRAQGDRVDIALHALGVCLHERSGGTDAADLERAVELFDQALDEPGPDDDERAGYLNSRGLSLRALGRSRAEPELLAHAEAAYRAARELAEPGSTDDVAAASNLATVLQDRAATDNRFDLLEEAVGLYRAVLPLVGGDRHRRITTNLATALIDLYRSSRDPTVLEQAAADLSAGAGSMPDGPSRRIVLANLGAALHEMFVHTGRITLLDDAIAVQDELIRPPNPRPPERTLNLGVSLLARFRRRRDRADLDRALGLFEEASAAGGSRVERASALNSQANALSLRFDLSREDGPGSRADIERCVDLREQAVATAAAGSLDGAFYRGNLGVDLLKRFELFADERDLLRAVEEQRRAVGDVPSRSAEQPVLLAGLADSLARLADHTGAAADVVAARVAYAQATTSGQESSPEQALGAAMRWGDWESRQHRWREAGNAYQQGLAGMHALFERQEQRADKESWLVDAQGLPAAAGLAHARAGSPRAAVCAIEHGRAMLLLDALARRPVRPAGAR